MPEAVSSTQEIAARVIEDAGDSNDSGNEFAADSPNEAITSEGTSSESAAPNGATDSQAGEPSSDKSDDLLTELGLKPRADGREHRIPQSRVEAMLTNRVKKAQEAAAAEWQAKVKAEADRVEAAERAESEFYHVVQTDPDRAISVLAAVNPAFAQYVRQQQAAAEAEAEFRMPDPDLPLPDGSRTYSVKGVQQAIVDAVEWATKRAESRLAERYKPVEDGFKQQQQQQQREAFLTQRKDHVTKIYADAQTWPGFKEHEAAINKAFNEDFADLDVESALNAAYRKIVLPVFQADHMTTRQRVIAELGKQPRATSVVGSQGQAAPSSGTGQRTVEQIARDVHKRLNQAQ